MADGAEGTSGTKEMWFQKGKRRDVAESYSAAVTGSLARKLHDTAGSPSQQKASGMLGAQKLTVLSPLLISFTILTVNGPENQAGPVRKAGDGRK